MVSRNFKGISSLQEVECLGASLNPDVKLLSLRMFSVPDNFVLASLNVFTNSCVTFGDYSSCAIDSSDTHRSRLRVLVFDLDAGESRQYGCKASTISSLGEPKTVTWSIMVTHESKCLW